MKLLYCGQCKHDFESDGFATQCPACGNEGIDNTVDANCDEQEHDLHETKTIFRWWDDEVIAIFPELPGDMSVYTCLSYMHVGQHGSCDPDSIITRSRPATQPEYCRLKRELESIGYTIKVIQKNRYAFMNVRRKEFERMGRNPVKMRWVHPDLYTMYSEPKFGIVSLYRESTKDHFEDGEQDDTTLFDYSPGDLTGVFDTFDELRKHLVLQFGLTADNEAWRIIDGDGSGNNPSIEIDQYEDSTGYLVESHDRGWEQFKRNEIVLYHTIYRVEIHCIRMYTQTSEELQQITGLQLAK